MLKRSTETWLQATAAVIVILVPFTIVSAADTLWGLQVGDLFSVETTIETRTTLTLGEAEPQTDHSTARFVIQYRIDAVRPESTVARVTITEADHVSGGDEDDATERHSAIRLTKIPILVTLDANGVVSNVVGVDAVFEQLSNADERSMKRLRHVLTEDSIATWIATPFWVTPPTAKADTTEKSASWQRIGDTTLGLFGKVRSILTFESKDTSEVDQKLVVSANMRHLTSAASADTNARLRVSDIRADVTDFSGHAQLKREQELAISDKADESPLPNISRRPWFESLSLQWTVEGGAKISSQSDFHNLKFRQTRSQTSKLLPGYQMRVRFFPPAPTP